MLPQFIYIYRLFKKIKELLQKHDQLKREESQYKEKCRNDLEKLQQNIE